MLLAKIEKQIRSGEIASAYYIYGNEAYWHDRLIGLLSASFPDSTEHLSGDETTWQDLRELLAQPSFFGSVLWVVRGSKALFDQKPDKWIEVVAPGNCLLLSAVGKTNPAPKSFAKAMAKIGGVIVRVQDPSWRDVSNWIRDKLRADGYSITRDALENLILVAGRSMERLDKEIEKLELFVHPDSRIAVSHVLDCVSPDPEMNTFALVDAVATKNRTRAFSEVEDLTSRGVNAIFIIAVLGNHFGLMWRVKESTQKGVAQSSLGKTLGVHPYAAKKALEQSRRWSFDEIGKALRLLRDIDEGLKTGRAEPVSAMDFVLSNLLMG